MRSKVTLGDYLSEAQLRTLVKDYQVEQKIGADNRTIGGSRTPRRRQSEELSGIAAVRARVQWQRHKRQRGEWKSNQPYMTWAELCDRFERRYERLESEAEIFAIMQGQRTRKKGDVRSNAIKANRPCPGRGGRIVHRPEIPEERCSKPIRVKSEQRSGTRSGRLL